MSDNWGGELAPEGPGIYAIINAVTGDRYVGQTKNLRQRAAAHLRDLNRGTHRTNKDQLLQHAWNQFGADAFGFEVLEEVRDNTGMPGFDYHVRPDNLSLAEHYYINQKGEYNVDPRIVRSEYQHLIDEKAWRDPTPPYPAQGKDNGSEPVGDAPREEVGKARVSVSGIFAFVNRTNGERFVGGSTDIHARTREYQGQLRAGKCALLLLQAAWDQYGADAFDMVVLEEVRDSRADEGFDYGRRPDNLSLARQYYISEKAEYNQDHAIVARRHHDLVRAKAWRE